MKTRIILVLAALLVASAAFGDVPSVTITAPTGSLTIPSFPYDSAITFNLMHEVLGTLNVLDITVNGTSILPGGNAIGNPFDNDGACSNNITGNTAIMACSNTDSNHATVTVRWTIPEPGSYVIVVSVKHQGATGVDEETVEVSVVTAGYPAPPAIANKYINSSSSKGGAPKVRGCVLNQIAKIHSEHLKYGPPGGPYNESLVQSDVRDFWPGCGGGTFQP